jgi:thioredoxin reductase (NADPH)
MARYLRDRLAAEPAVEVLLGHEVRSVGGDPRLETVVAEDSAAGELTRLEAAAIVVLIGARPGTGWLAGEIALDDDGYILTGPQLGAAPREPWQTLGREPFLVETSRPGVFAVGDVRSGSTKMVAPATAAWLSASPERTSPGSSSGDRAPARDRAARRMSCPSIDPAERAPGAWHALFASP